MAHWINEDVNINFKPVKFIQDIIANLEEYDKEGNWSYINEADALDHYTKECVIEDIMTTDQRNKLIEKYCDYYDKF